MDKEPVKTLNREQLQAVKYGQGPLLIIAGAGTGKTTVITERIKYLIHKGLAKPNEILALTFTEKAAAEMQARVDVALPYGLANMWISTFHSFCDRVLKQEALHIGLTTKYHLMTEAESIQFIRNNLFKFKLDYFRPLGNPTKFIDGILQHFSRLQDEDILPDQYLKWVNSQKGKSQSQKDDKLEIAKWSELAEAYRTYSELKVKQGLMDYGDLIGQTLELFRKRRNVLSSYLTQFKYILVDEFQDTNFAQNELAKMLAGSSHNLTVCGDDDQSIYRFRGAAVSNIIQFRKNFPQAKIVVLTKNYRSTQEILDKAYQLIGHNNPDRLEAVEKINKKLIAARGVSGEPVKFIHADRVENEAEAVAGQIAALLAEDQSLQYSDFAILVRANNHAEPFGRALGRQGIPYQFLGPGRLFKQREVVDLIAYLKVLDNFEDSTAYYRLLTNDYFAISPRDIVALNNYARRYNLSLFEAAEKINDIKVASATREKIKNINSLINSHFKLLAKESAGQILYYFLQDSGLMQNLVSPQSTEAQKKAANISKFFDKLKTYEVDHNDASVRAVVDWIDLSTEVGESPLAADTDWVDVNAVNILTVHSSKGLEFPIVFLVNLVSSRFPTIQRREQIPIPEALIKELLPSGDFHQQEERRLFYVGMTRAQNRLFLTAADYYGEGKREKHLSPFIFEALGDAAGHQNPLPQNKQLSFLDYRVSQQPTAAAAADEFHLDYLSYSQIETFRTCPLHYKFKYIYRIPTLPSAAQSFGISLHSALKDFYLSIKSGQKPSQKLLLKSLTADWVRDGYKSQSHEQKSLQAAKEYLTDFYKQQFNPQVLPLLLEQSFVVSLPVVAGEKPLKIGGKIDRVDLLPDGKIEIIDYKTGANIPTQRAVDHDLQLTFYALAAKYLQDQPFARQPEEILLSLYYFDGQKKITTQRTTAELATEIRNIYDTRKLIEKSDFKCQRSFLCRFCEYKFLCEEA